MEKIQPENELSGVFSWRSTLAGALLVLLVYLILTALGIAFGGSPLSAEGLGQGSAGWLTLSCMIALFIGGYLAGRISTVETAKGGGIQGLVICALFFVIALSSVRSPLGDLTRGVSVWVESIRGQIGELEKNNEIQFTIGFALGDLNFTSPAGDVAHGLAVRLIRGDREGARAYLAAQAGISPQESDRRIQRFESLIQSIVAETASSVSRAGWVLFGILVLSGASAWAGGYLGARKTLSGTYL